MAAKVFRTIDEQLDILKSKGLAIEDYDRAKEILLRENYFFLNGYRSPLLIINLYLVTFLVKSMVIKKKII